MMSGIILVEQKLHFLFLVILKAKCRLKHNVVLPHYLVGLMWFFNKAVASTKIIIIELLVDSK